MTGRRLAILMLSMSLLLIGILIAPAVWQWVAYERLGHPEDPVPVQYEKRRAWLPGPNLIHPPQQCAACYFADRPLEFAAACKRYGILEKQVATHDRCYDGMLGGRIGVQGGGEQVPGFSEKDGNRFVINDLETALQVQWYMVYSVPGEHHSRFHCTCAANDHKGAP